MLQTWEEMVNGDDPSIASASAYANLNTIADVSPTPQIQLLVGPSGQNVHKGQWFHAFATGKFSNTGTPTLVLGLYYGGVAGVKLAASTTITTITAATNWPWRLEAWIQIRSTGTGGVARTTGWVYMPASLTQFQAPYPIDAAAVADVTIDTTAQKAVTVGATWGTANAANTLTCDGFILERLN